jgi:hypothetical protein
MFSRVEMHSLVAAAMTQRIANLISFETLEPQHQGIIRRIFGNRAHFAIIAKYLRGADQQMVEASLDHFKLLTDQVHIGNLLLTMLQGADGNQ